MQKTRTIATFIAIISMMFTSFQVHAQDLIYVYEDEYGNEINYLMDENGTPYNYIDGELVYFALPLEHLKVTDENLICQLNEGLVLEDFINRAVPTQYVDLSTESGLTSSPVYTKNISFASGNVHGLDYLKFNTQHAQVRFKTTNIVKESIFAGNDITFYFYYYSEILDEWYSTSMTDVNCTSVNGVGIQFSPSAHPYGKFTVVKSSNWESVTVNIWTLPVT